jgi:hypothetical protein
VGAGSADCDLVEVLLGLLLSHGQTSIVRHEEGNCESWAVLQWLRAQEDRSGLQPLVINPFDSRGDAPG